jgi:hypothetical protein
MINQTVKWPDGKSFAFTIFDDTDSATLAKIGDVYSFLADRGFRTTKSVWPVRGTGRPLCEGTTCEDDDYVEWLRNLQRNGFEVGYHLNTFHSSLRQQIEAGLTRFKDLFDHYPMSMANHVGCLDSMYWGKYRLTGLHQYIYSLLTLFKHTRISYGHLPGDYFWGDLCQARIRYVRNFVFQDINTLKACPFMPYRDPDRPYVNYWFASSQGHVARTFNQCISEESQDRLEQEGGACIMYTHLARGFLSANRLDSRFRHLMERLSKKNGWFVPVSTLLDYLLEQRGGTAHASLKQLKSMERLWLRQKISDRKTS